MKTKLDQWCEAVIEAGWLAALIVAPMFFNVFSSRVFEPDKISLVRSIALIMLLAWLIKLANGGAPWLPAFDSSTQAPSISSQSLWASVRRNPFVIPVVLLILAYLLSTLFSVARFVSWFGSYQRLQGTYSFLSYVTIASLAAAHLRTPEQLRRLQHVIVITSLPIAIYGVVQHYGIDPLPWGGDVTTRVAANAGNAIFLSAYLIMAFFFTLERVYNSFAQLLINNTQESDNQEITTSLAGGSYLFILLVQALAIFWTQSRGPLLGLMAGFYLFVLLLFSALRPKNHRIFTIGWVGTGIAGGIFLVLLNTTAIANLARSIPSLARLSTILDLESNTAQVRILIWNGASEMMRPHSPLIYPNGNRDSVNFMRPLIGYGPEAMWVAYNPFYPPKLAHHEQRNASPDRSHNETWDSLVITGFLGFGAYMTLFISIFYSALRWLGLLVNRRDNLLFGAILGVCSIFLTAYMIIADGTGWRFFGVGVPAGILLGLVLYTMLAAFLHPDFKPDARDLPRQLLIIALLATAVAHFVEIHFGIAIAATRTYFWVQTALLLVLGMRWAQPPAFAKAQELANLAEAEEELVPEPQTTKGKRPQKGGQAIPALRRARRPVNRLPSLPTTMMTDLLIFFTFVFIYSTNAKGLQGAATVLLSSVTRRLEGSELIGSPAIFFLMLFTWSLAATIGLATEALAQRRAPELLWWLRGYLLHAAVVWGGWLLYGLLQGWRLIPGSGGVTLDEQLNHVAGHFAVYTTLVILWVFGAGTVYALPALRERLMAIAARPAISLVVGVIAAIIIFSAISTVNVGLVKADIIYKQGQQFDNQRNWVSSIELYRRALNARKTEDHYMLFLGRALLEQAKAAQPEGAFKLDGDATVDAVLALTPDKVAQMARPELLRAAEIILLEAQRVNPLNTDHTANLARLYRTWADLSSNDANVRQQQLDKSIASYKMAVQLSPNAAHLWNERGNAHQARNENDEAEAAYQHSHSLDPLYEQTYILLADFYIRLEQFEKAVALLEDGIVKMDESPIFVPTVQMYSFLGVAKARLGDLRGAIDANEKAVALHPTNINVIRNLMLLYRDLKEYDKALAWFARALELTPREQVNERVGLHQVAVQIYQTLNQTEQMIGQYEEMRQLDPNNVEILKTLSNLYNAAQNDSKAVEVAQALMTLDPSNFQHPLNIAQALQRAGQIDKAVEFANQALQLAPAEQKPAIEQFIASLKTSS